MWFAVNHRQWIGGKLSKDEWIDCQAHEGLWPFGLDADTYIE
jgi:hypothetical protein